MSRRAIQIFQSGPHNPADQQAATAVPGKVKAIPLNIHPVPVPTERFRRRIDRRAAQTDTKVHEIQVKKHNGSMMFTTEL